MYLNIVEAAAVSWLESRRLEGLRRASCKGKCQCECVETVAAVDTQDHLFRLNASLLRRHPKCNMCLQQHWSPLSSSSSSSSCWSKSGICSILIVLFPCYSSGADLVLYLFCWFGTLLVVSIYIQLGPISYNYAYAYSYTYTYTYTYAYSYTYSYNPKNMPEQ